MPDTTSQQTGASKARVYDHLLGGKNNRAEDRRVANRLMRAKPHLRGNVLANRRFLVRAVTHLAASAGISQFLDIGTGLPNMDNTHEVAQRVNPDARVVYVDNDPEVVAWARALLTSGTGVTAYLEADLADPGHILTEAAHTLDFTRPVAVMLLGILYLIPDQDDPYRIVATLTNAVPSGSYLAISHPASDIHPEESAKGARIYEQSMGTAQTNRTQEEVTRFFTGLDLIEPGVVPLNQWRPDPGDNTTESISSWAAVGRKP